VFGGYILEESISVMSFVTMRLITPADLAPTEMYAYTYGRIRGYKTGYLERYTRKEIIRYEEYQYKQEEIWYIHDAAESLVLTRKIFFVLSVTPWHGPQREHSYSIIV
jgi:hypothetical protein